MTANLVEPGGEKRQRELEPDIQSIGKRLRRGVLAPPERILGTPPAGDRMRGITVPGLREEDLLYHSRRDDESSSNPSIGVISYSALALIITGVILILILVLVSCCAIFGLYIKERDRLIRSLMEKGSALGFCSGERPTSQSLNPVSQSHLREHQLRKLTGYLVFMESQQSERAIKDSSNSAKTSNDFQEMVSEREVEDHSPHLRSSSSPVTYEKLMNLMHIYFEAINTSDPVSPAEPSMVSPPGAKSCRANSPNLQSFNASAKGSDSTASQCGSAHSSPNSPVINWPVLDSGQHYEHIAHCTWSDSDEESEN
ncbi:hypothetical protein EOD39_7799 [Acipenser ruthenus]|uniref:Uncharacterized protein n=1 Tax=Acipenser ruthenus TaxID=7906 RepID=A0A444U5W3_ACIRT|nr:hypothetical protein EOD39_7799 [Acipenser ruthenus]